jgi:hypothetical protein
VASRRVWCVTIRWWQVVFEFQELECIRAPVQAYKIPADAPARMGVLIAGPVSKLQELQSHPRAGLVSISLMLGSPTPSFIQHSWISEMVSASR